MATAAEMNAIASLLDLVALDGLTFDYRLDSWRRRPLAPRRDAQRRRRRKPASFRSIRSRRGSMCRSRSSSGRRRCSPTLGEKRRSARRQALLDWPEPIIDGRIDLGTVVYETLATSLDPYPKREGASFDWSQGEPSGGQEAPEAAHLRPLPR